jgi:hypothetical protein
MVKMFFKSLFLIMILFTSCMISGSAEDAFNKGTQLFKAGKTKQAFRCFKNAAKKAPDIARYYFAAAQTAPDQNTALMYTKFAWEKGYKNQVSMIMLLKQSFYLEKEKKLEYALSLFKELPDSSATDLFKGELFYQFDKFDSAYTLWNSEFIRTENSSLCPKIGNVLVRMGKPEQAIDFLFKCKSDKILDSDGYLYLASLLAIQYDFKGVDRLFIELSESNFYNDNLRLEYATFLVFNDRFDEALRLIEKPAGPGSIIQKQLIDLRLTTLKIFIAIMQQKNKSIDSLLSINQTDTLLKGEKTELYTAIRAYLDKDTVAYDLLKNSISKLPPDPITMILYAEAALKKKLFKEAVNIYAKLPGIILWAPRIVVTRAQVLSLLGDDDEALEVVSYMHKKRVFTRLSLELFRNLTLKKDLLDKSYAAQQLLERQYSNDIGLKWNGLLLAIKSEKYDSALTISRNLSKLYPDDERFVVTELTLLLMKKEYQLVIDQALKCKLPAIKLKPIEAAAYKGLGDTAKAISAYESVVEERKDPILVMQLAEMYYQKKMYNKATNLYTKLIEQKTDSLSKDSLQLAILLNNNAWTIMTAGTGDLSGALSMVKKAYEMASNNLNIIDTYASILLEMGKYKECIALIEGNTDALAQKRLLCHIAQAYEKMKNKNRAKRSFEDALAAKKDDQKLAILLSDEQIKMEIKRLSDD